VLQEVQHHLSVLKKRYLNPYEVAHKINVTQYHSGRRHHGVCRYFHFQGTAGTDSSIVNRCRICFQIWVTSHCTQFHRSKDHKCNFYTSENSDLFLYTRGPKTFQKSRSHLQILGIRRMLGACKLIHIFEYKEKTTPELH
jgi:hypothetical protein